MNGSPEEGSVDWYHWIAARCQEEQKGKHPAWRPGGAAHAQWKAMEAYIVRLYRSALCSRGHR